VGDRSRKDKDIGRIQKESGRDKERARILEPRKRCCKIREAVV
jgi:hypothetical protein